MTAGVTVGNAVQRNRAKRLMREAMNPHIPMMKPGYSLILVGRSPLAHSNLEETSAALRVLLNRAKLLDIQHDR